MTFAEYRERWSLLPVHVVAEMAFTTPAAVQAAMWATVAERVTAERELLEVADRVLTEEWPPPKRHRPPARPRTVPTPGTFGPDEDPLKKIDPREYIEALTGETVPANGKILCPLHAERTPSFHVYRDGWHCFGCNRGGGVIDLAAELWQITPRGRGYWELRDRIIEALEPTPLATKERHR